MDKKGLLSNMKVIVATSLVWVMLFSATAVFANPGAIVQGIRGGITVQIDGVNMNLAAADQPVVIDGRTFLPVRAIADGLGLDVDWNAATSTVVIQSAGTPATPPATGGVTPPPTTPAVQEARPLLVAFPSHGASGTRINQNRNGGQNAVIDSRMFPNSWICSSASNYELTFPLNGQHTLLTGYVGARDGANRGGNLALTSDIRFFGDGVLLGEFTIRYGEAPQAISFDVTGVDNLVIMTRFRTSTGGGGLEVVIANPQIR